MAAFLRCILVLPAIVSEPAIVLSAVPVQDPALEIAEAPLNRGTKVDESRNSIGPPWAGQAHAVGGQARKYRTVWLLLA